MKKVFLLLIIFMVTGNLLFAGEKDPNEPQQKEPEKLQDNSFLIEEAYNQEPGIVQHIQSYQYNSNDESWVYIFTQEWPLHGKKHQISFLIPVMHLTDDTSATGTGDILINYRYQLVDKDKVALSPRFSVIIPTGNYKKGLGTGSFGFQTNIPLSVELSEEFVTHWNIGLTVTPGAREPGGASANTIGFNYGASIIWLTSEHFNLMFEAAGTSNENVIADDLGRISTPKEDSFFINPGMRFAINCDSGLQIVPGISFPIGVGPSEGENGVFLYLSFEHKMFDPGEEDSSH
ncbi:MAG: transporter [Candidatus Eremiobacterota bacterium]